MDITGEYRIDAPRERVWEALNDPAVLERCIPGCESIERVSDTEMKGRVTAAIGPVKARFNTKIRLEDLNPPESYTLSGEAKAGATGFGRGSARVRLDEVDGATQLAYSADFKVGGKLAQVGSRLVVGATRKTADEFFANFAREFGAETSTSADVAETAQRAGPPWLAIAAGIGAGLLILWILLG